MVRGLPLQSPADFAAVRDVMMRDRASYKEKATPRTHYADDVYSSTDLPASQSIHLHNENSYTLDFPGILMFGCVVAPATGGATTVADVRRVLALMPGELVARFRGAGWVLLRNYRRHVSLSWEAAFGSADRADVQRYCDEHLIGHRWLDDGNLRTAQRRAAIVRHPQTGQEVWFNHTAFWSRWSLEDDVREILVETYGEEGLPFETAYGDGSALSKPEVRAINEAYMGATRREPWRQADLLLVDNILSAHGRDAFEGERRIIVAMGEPVSLSSCRPTIEPAAFEL